MIGISGTVLRQEVDSKNEEGRSTHLEEKIKGKNKRERSIPNDAGEVDRAVVVRIPECEDDTEVGDEDNDNETKLIFEMSRLMRFEFVKGEEEVLRYFASMEEDKVEGVTNIHKKLVQDATKWEIMQKKAELWRLYKTDEVEWRQKSRCKWVQEGDHNTRYFHAIALTRRKTNFVEKIKWGDDLYDKPQDIRGVIVSYFENHFTEREVLELRDMKC
ncbi:hypothetical protein SCA6_002464 [Theobroma cacao]